MDLKICSNPECGSPLPLHGNSTKKACDNKCKNRAAYIHDRIYYKWEDYIAKARKRNIHILEYLMINNELIVTSGGLTTMGFNFAVANIPEIHDGKNVFRFGNIGVRLLSSTRYELFNF